MHRIVEAIHEFLIPRVLKDTSTQNVINDICRIFLMVCGLLGTNSSVNRVFLESGCEIGNVGR